MVKARTRRTIAYTGRDETAVLCRNGLGGDSHVSGPPVRRNVRRCEQ